MEFRVLGRPQSASAAPVRVSALAGEDADVIARFQAWLRAADRAASTGGWRHGHEAAWIGLVLGTPWIVLDAADAAGAWRTEGLRLTHLVEIGSWSIL
jgi:hypothetical protein